MRKCIIILFVFCCLFSSACARKDDGRVRITYQTMETLPEQRKALAKLVGEFEKIHPNIKVEVLTSTTSFQKLMVQIAGGNAPDVFYYVTNRLPVLIKNKSLLDLSPFIEAEKDLDMSNYFKELLGSCQWEGKYYCFPFHYSTDVIFYNKDMFRAHGVAFPNESWTWDDYLDAAIKLTKKENNKTVQYGTLLPRPLLVMKSFGAKIFNEDNTKCLLDSEESKEALQYIKDLADKHNVAPDAGSIKDLERMDGVDMFSTGKVAMLMGRTYMLSEFRKLRKFNWDIAPLPNGKRRYSRLAVGGNCISVTTKHPKEAWTFVEFYSGKVGSEICGTSGNCVPALKEIAYSESFLYAPPVNSRLFVDSIKYAEIDNPGLVVWEEFYQRILQDTIDKILCNMMSIEDGLRQIVTESDKILNRTGN